MIVKIVAVFHWIGPKPRQCFAENVPEFRCITEITDCTPTYQTYLDYQIQCIVSNAGHVVNFVVVSQNPSFFSFTRLSLWNVVFPVT